MDFAVLGPLVVSSDGRQIAAPTPMVQRLLAILVAADGRAVPVDALIEALWAKPPRTARKTLLVYVHRLRRLLGAEERVTFDRTAGYQLAVAVGDEIDARAFAELTRLAAAAAGADPGRAVEVFRQALQLWRGPAFGALHDVDLVRSAAARLDEQRLDAVERCLQLELELGRHSDVIGELMATARAHPYREGLQAALMLALYRLNRQAEALEVYRDTYQRLGEELGVEPGLALQDLHTRMLRNDPALAPEPRAAASGVNQLPMITPTFVGRAAELDALRTALTDPSANGPVVVALSGMGGIGKTTLAVRAASDCRHAYPGGCLFVDLRGAGDRPADSMVVLGSFLRALGVPPREVPDDPDERLALYRSTTARQTVLVVLDNARDEAQVRPLLPGGAGCAVLVTSRPILSGLDCRLTTELAALSLRESIDLLEGIVDGARLADDPAVEDLAGACAGLPLALRVVAGRLVGERDLTAGRLALLIRDRERALPEMAVGDLGVHASFDLSYQRLTPAAMTLMHRLGRSFQLDFSADTSRVLLGADPGTALAELLRVQLLAATSASRDPSRGRFRLHDLVRTFAQAQARGAEPAATLDVSILGLQRWYLDAVYQANRLTNGGQMPPRITLADPPSDGLRFGTYTEAAAWFALEADNLVAAVHEAGRRGWHTEAWQLAYSLRPFFQDRYMLDDWHETHSVALAAAVELGDPGAQARVRESLAVALRLQQRLDAATAACHEALLRYEQVDDQIGIGRIHQMLGNITDQRGDHAAAEAHYRSALALPEYASVPYYATVIQFNLGTLYGEQDRYAEAADMLQSVLAAALENQIWDLICHAHHNLAHLHLHSGSHAEGEQHAREQIAVAQHNQLTHRVARGWDVLGLVLAAQGKPGAAEAFEQAIRVYAELGDPRVEAARAELDKLNPASPALVSAGKPVQE